MIKPAESFLTRWITYEWRIDTKLWEILNGSSLKRIRIYGNNNWGYGASGSRYIYLANNGLLT